MLPIEEEGLAFGFAVDLYTVSARPGAVPGRYSSEYSWAGYMVHQLKYQNLSIAQKEELYAQIAQRITPLLQNSGFEKPLVILPAPSFLSNVYLNYHKVPYRLAKMVSEVLNAKWYPNYLLKTVDIESKSSQVGEEWAADAITHPRHFRYPTNVLIVDDTYGEGKTLRACIRALQLDPNVNAIYFFALARNRTTGLKGVKGITES